jgi:hypothetical protein
VEEIIMKKLKTVADLLTVADTCIEAFEAQAQLLESRGKGPAKKEKDDQEVNMTDQGDRGYYDPVWDSSQLLILRQNHGSCAKHYRIRRSDS